MSGFASDRSRTQSAMWNGGSAGLTASSVMRSRSRALLEHESGDDADTAAERDEGEDGFVAFDFGVEVRRDGASVEPVVGVVAGEAVGGEYERDRFPVEFGAG